MSFVINNYGNADTVFEGQDYAKWTGFEAGDNGNGIVTIRQFFGNYLYVQRIVSGDDFIFRIDGTYVMRRVSLTKYNGYLYKNAHTRTILLYPMMYTQ